MATVLVVEKQPNLRLLMEMELDDADHQGVFLPDGVDALRVIKREQPDVVVLGVGWPPEEDVGTLGRIRNHYPHLPVIVFSSSMELRKPAIVRMCDAFLLKNSNLDILIEEIGQQVKQRRRATSKIFA